MENLEIVSREHLVQFEEGVIAKASANLEQWEEASRKYTSGVSRMCLAIQNMTVAMNTLNSDLAQIKT